MKIKICGMKSPENIEQIAAFKPDYLGFIFYERSARYAGELDETVVQQLPHSIQRVGVFVNASTETVEATAKRFGLDVLQLHGDESAAYCAQLAAKGYRLVKAFRVGEDFDFSVCTAYAESCVYFLFDTKGKTYGGTGHRFDWSILEQYDNQKPFFLSGGIGLEELAAVRALQHLNIHAIDVNSRFELAPGLKDVQLVQDLFAACARDME